MNFQPPAEGAIAESIKPVADAIVLKYHDLLTALGQEALGSIPEGIKAPDTSTWTITVYYKVMNNYYNLSQYHINKLTKDWRNRSNAQKVGQSKYAYDDPSIHPWFQKELQAWAAMYMISHNSDRPMRIVMGLENDMIEEGYIKTEHMQ
ncbi:hypothetical protein EDC01DRAFT_626105 [Geopyxis carbonaria]|nr:hypothetical protein EDC01DRAFT_626105 [Geopyxis carbonaria]